MNLQNSMLRNIRTRLFLTYLVLILFTTTVMGALFYFITKERLLKNKEEYLSRSADVFMTFIVPYMEMEENLDDALIPAVRLFMRQSLEQLDYRLQVIDRSGEIIMDSQGIPPYGGRADPRFYRALEGRTEIWLERSPSGQMMYKCLPIKLRNQVPGAAKLSISLEEIDQLFSAMRKYFFLTFLMSVLAAIGAALFFIRTLMRPVTRIRDTARGIAQGDLESRVNYDSPDELGDLSRTINFMADELKKLEQARASFLGNVSHELRTPLTIIKGFVITLLSSEGIPQEWQRSLELINRETDRLTRLVEELLELTRLRSGRVGLDYSWCNMEEILRSTELQVGQKAEQAGVKMVFDTASGLPRIWADVDRVKEVLLNLIDNALKYAASGGVVEVRTRTTEELLEISVKDNGPGIPEPELPFVFERFFRGNKKGISGTGLGLAIVKGILEAHGGRISVESHEGEGTSFKAGFLLKHPDTPRYRTLLME